MLWIPKVNTINKSVDSFHVSPFLGIALLWLSSPSAIGLCDSLLELNQRGTFSINTGTNPSLHCFKCFLLFSFLPYVVSQLFSTLDLETGYVLLHAWLKGEREWISSVGWSLIPLNCRGKSSVYFVWKGSSRLKTVPWQPKGSSADNSLLYQCLLSSPLWSEEKSEQFF